MGLFTCLQKYTSKTPEQKGIKKQHQSKRKQGISNETFNNGNASNLFIFIEISRSQRHSISSTYIRLLTLIYKKQDRASNSNLE